MYRNKPILLVDDSPLIRALMKKTLSEKGYIDLDTAEDGVDAQKKIGQKKYSMVISDYDMPNMNGGELLNWIKQTKPEILVIMLSAQGQKETIISLMRLAENYIVKDEMTSIKDDLFFVIEKTFDKDRLLKENARLLQELRLRDKKMHLELQTAQEIISESMEFPPVKSEEFEIEVLCSLSNVIGGDYYTLRKKGNKIQLVLADISGHGIPAALLVLTLKNAVDKVLQEETTNKAIDLLNDELHRLFPAAKYATVSCLELCEETKTIYYTNEFQNPILYLKQDGSIEEVDNGSIKLLGIFDATLLGHPFESKCDKLNLLPGEKLLIFTDGIVETTNPEKEEFGMDRIKALLARNKDKNPKELVKALFDEAVLFSSTVINDDVTIIAIAKK